MKSLFVLLLIMLFQISSSGTGYGQDFFNQAGSFFADFVQNGQVRYQAVKKNRQQLDKLVELIGKFPYESQSKPVQKAFLINAYNLLTIQQVVDRYPIEGPLKVDGFFNGITHQVAGRQVTLDQLEKEWLYRDFSDPRLHFALVCAAKGCPPLASFAFEPEKLDQQLDQVSRSALQDPGFIRIDSKNKQVQLSQIFEWYQQDFLKNSKNFLDYINKYREKQIPNNYRIEFYPYNWNLNDAGS